MRWELRIPDPVSSKAISEVHNFFSIDSRGDFADSCMLYTRGSPTGVTG